MSVLIAAVASTLASAATASLAARFSVSLGLVVAIAGIALRASEDDRRRLREEVITDPLTGAFNRRHLESALRVAIERRNRMSEPASLLVFDVDRFKEINDTFGHLTGDEVLKGLVGIAIGRMRGVDLLFRVGGDEFALLLAGARYADALLVAEDLRTLVGTSILPGAGSVSISIGASELQKGQAAGDWLGDADAALYRAKRGGRNRIAGRALMSAPPSEERPLALAAESWRSRKAR